VPSLLPWTALGDGSVYPSTAGYNDLTETVFSEPVEQVKADYTTSLDYSLTTLMSYVETYLDDNTVVLFLGDHQPVATVSGDNAARDVPVGIIAKDPAVLDRTAGWGWTEGLRPGPQSPLWGMQVFRDRFLNAFA
jgi:hypothetical protein